VSPKGAVGVFQHMPATAKELGIDPTDPTQSIQGGVKYMGQLLNQYKKDPVQALAAYNWGMGNLNKQGLDAAPPETQKYLETILAGT
jgi:soluble lytic murein transglycosylase-like protein